MIFHMNARLGCVSIVNYLNIGAMYAKCHSGHVEIVHPGRPGGTSRFFTISNKRKSRPSFCTPFFVVT